MRRSAAPLSIDKQTLEWIFWRAIAIFARPLHSMSGAGLKRLTAFTPDRYGVRPY